MAEKAELKKTGWYAVVHFGADEKDSTPCFLRKIPYKNAQGEMECSYHHFTYNLHQAALFPNWYDAIEAEREIEGRLWKDNHILKGHVKVVELATIVVGTPKKD